MVTLILNFIRTLMFFFVCDCWFTLLFVISRHRHKIGTRTQNSLVINLHRLTSVSYYPTKYEIQPMVQIPQLCRRLIVSVLCNPPQRRANCDEGCYLIILIYLYMVTLTFKNYVIAKINSKFLSNFAITNVSKTLFNKLEVYQYKITPEEVRIQEQAQIFARFYVANGHFKNSFLNNTYRLNQVLGIIADSYVYSYVKAVFYGYGSFNNERFAAVTSAQNNVFAGHKLLHDTICMGYGTEFLNSTTSLGFELKVDEDTLEDIQSFNMFKQNYDSTSRLLFNYELESVLQFMMENSKTVVKVEALRSSVPPTTRDFFSNPLGNMAYSADMRLLCYTECTSLVTDKHSFLWNKACGITILSCPEVDIDDIIYDTCLFEKYDPINLGTEIKAITGFNPYGEPKRNLDILTKSPKDGDSGDAPDAKQTMNNNRNQRWGNNNNSSRNNSRRKDNLSNVTLTKMANARKSAMDLLKQGYDVVTDDRVQHIAGIIADLTGQRVNARNLKRYVGGNIKDIFNNYNLGISPNPEYDAFYGTMSNSGYLPASMSNQIDSK